MAFDVPFSLAPIVLASGVTGAVGVIGGALALGIRHGVDWDHIAAITDITSTAAATDDESEAALLAEHHERTAEEPHHILMAATAAAGAAGGHTTSSWAPPAPPREEPALFRTIRQQRRAISLGTIYALGHGTMVIALGLAAILFAEVLPTWVDNVMEKVVGLTLLFLGVYLIVSLVRYFRGEGEFRIRSRWMLVFSGVRKGARKLRSVLPGADHHHAHPHDQSHEHDQYGVGTSYSIGLLHGIGAETGTQVLIIGTAVGAASKGMAVAALLTFVLGLLISNSLVIGLTATGFTSARRREALYVAAGALAAVFSLFLGVLYLSASGGILPSLDPLVRWVGGPDG